MNQLTKPVEVLTIAIGVDDLFAFECDFGLCSIDHVSMMQ